jgi:hypothetical protein
MKSWIIIGTLLFSGKLCCAQSSVSATHSSERKVMTDKGREQPDSAKAAGNYYLMSKDFKGSSTPDEKRMPQLNTAPKEEDQKTERVPR